MQGASLVLLGSAPAHMPRFLLTFHLRLRLPPAPATYACAMHIMRAGHESVVRLLLRWPGARFNTSVAVKTAREAGHRGAVRLLLDWRQSAVDPAEAAVPGLVRVRHSGSVKESACTTVIRISLCPGKQGPIGGSA